jgi:hypothetical protein
MTMASPSPSTPQAELNGSVKRVSGKWNANSPKKLHQFNQDEAAGSYTNLFDSPRDLAKHSLAKLQQEGRQNSNIMRKSMIETLSVFQSTEIAKKEPVKMREERAKKDYRKSMIETPSVFQSPETAKKENRKSMIETMSVFQSPETPKKEPVKMREETAKKDNRKSMIETPSVFQIPETAKKEPVKMREETGKKENRKSMIETSSVFQSPETGKKEYRKSMIETMSVFQSPETPKKEPVKREEHETKSISTRHKSEAKKKTKSNINTKVENKKDEPAANANELSQETKRTPSSLESRGRDRKVMEEMEQIIEDVEVNELETKMDEKVAECLRLAAIKSLAYTDKVYDVLVDQIILCPSLSEVIMDFSLIEIAEELFGGKFPLVCTGALRSVATYAKMEEENKRDSVIEVRAEREKPQKRSSKTIIDKCKVFDSPKVTKEVIGVKPSDTPKRGSILEKLNVFDSPRQTKKDPSIEQKVRRGSQKSVVEKCSIFDSPKISGSNSLVSPQQSLASPQQNGTRKRSSILDKCSIFESPSSIKKETVGKEIVGKEIVGKEIVGKQDNQSSASKARQATDEEEEELTGEENRDDRVLMEINRIIRAAEIDEIDDVMDEKVADCLRMAALKSPALTHKWYDVFSDVIICCPSVISLLMNFSLIELAEETYGRDLPMLYTTSIRSVAALSAAEEKDDDLPEYVYRLASSMSCQDDSD